MDGGQKQEEMTAQLKREVKEGTRYRYQDPPARPGDRSLWQDDSGRRQPQGSHAMHISGRDASKPNSDIPVGGTARQAPSIDQQECTARGKNLEECASFQKSDSMLIMFYLDHVLPFLFPFYKPSDLLGGKSWILDLMINSPVYRQASLCQSSYFFSLARGTYSSEAIWERVLMQTRDAFEVLRQALQVIEGPEFTEHIPGAVRILASVMQLQRFETTILSFDNCQAHLNAALALFGQILESSDDTNGATSSFDNVLKRLGPSIWDLPPQCKAPSAEQAAFKFATSQLMLDDIIASTIHQEKPKLDEHHAALLYHDSNMESTIDFKTTIGCQNWVLLEVGNIATLDAWKQRSKASRDLDIMELVLRATPIKDSLQSQLVRLESDQNQGRFLRQRGSLLDVFITELRQDFRVPSDQSPVVTRIWAHAALIYLFVVVSGWQPANNDVRYHVGQVIELIRHQIAPPTLLRSMAWPFCIAGCLAEPLHEAPLRSMVEALQPSAVFGTIRKALEIMESAWKTRSENINSDLDLATCFKNQGHLVLLV